MTEFLLGLAVFLGVHSISIVAPRWRDAQVARHPSAWKIGYSLVSIASFVVMVHGYGIARQSPVVLWTPPAGMRHLALVLMLPVFPLLLAAYWPGRIKAKVKHPMLLATKIWATAHLLANGTLNDAILFGAFLAWAVADRIAVKRRVVPHETPGAPPRPYNDVVAVVGGLVIYVVFVLWAHRWLIGVSPIG